MLAQHFNGASSDNRFPVLLNHDPVGNLVFGILAYLPVAAAVPLALHLLARTGQPPRSIGLVRPTLRWDVWPALGLIGASWGTEIVLLLVLNPLFTSHSSLVSTTGVGHVPAYYVIYGIAISATTAVAEEVMVNGYLLVRLNSSGWRPQRALLLSLALRTSYHVYYGLGFILTVPFGYFVTRSFQKNRRLTRPIVAHFLFDATLFTIAGAGEVGPRPDESGPARRGEGDLGVVIMGGGRRTGSLWPARHGRLAVARSTRPARCGRAAADEAAGSEPPVAYPMTFMTTPPHRPA